MFAFHSFLSICPWLDNHVWIFRSMRSGICLYFVFVPLLNEKSSTWALVHQLFGCICMNFYVPERWKQASDIWLEISSKMKTCKYAHKREIECVNKQNISMKKLFLYFFGKLEINLSLITRWDAMRRYLIPQIPYLIEFCMLWECYGYSHPDIGINLSHKRTCIGISYLIVIVKSGE